MLKKGKLGLRTKWWQLAVWNSNGWKKNNKRKKEKDTPFHLVLMNIYSKKIMIPLLMKWCWLWKRIRSSSGKAWIWLWLKNYGDRHAKFEGEEPLLFIKGFKPKNKSIKQIKNDQSGYKTRLDYWASKINMSTSCFFFLPRTMYKWTLDIVVDHYKKSINAYKQIQNRPLKAL